MKIAVTGSHGLIGAALASRLESESDTVVRLVRDAAGPGCVTWDPVAGRLDPADLAGIDGVVHLAGAGIGDRRWNPARRLEIESSRIASTALLAGALATMDPRPSVLVSGSAVGWYGDRGDEELTEASGPGTGFLAGVCQRWEAATAPAEAAGIRTVHARSGVVLAKGGGALAKQLPLFRLGVGGRLGSGRQYTSWISLDDEVTALEFALRTSTLTGAANLTAPAPVTNAAFTAALGAALHRPAVVPVPAFALRLALGAGMADEMVLASQRAVPAALAGAGFTWAHPTLEAALAAVTA